MLHELKSLFQIAEDASQKGLKSVLASVVALDGSSYRRPGVRMLILEDDSMHGAVSGGCVEKDILRQAQEVFAIGTPKMMQYDGRYRLGCEGLLYILIEPVQNSKAILEALIKQDEHRSPFKIVSKFKRDEGLQPTSQSVFHFDSGLSLSVFHAEPDMEEKESFTQEVKTSMRLIIIGSEHDAVALTQLASGIGFQVDLVAPPDDPKQLANFPGATNFYHYSPEQLSELAPDSRTAVLLMTHSFAKDLKYLQQLTFLNTGYIGLLGPKKRREKLFDALLEYNPDLDPAFIDGLYGPAGINIGAETAYEIGISIVAEILAVMRGQTPKSLKEKKGGIHD